MSKTSILIVENEAIVAADLAGKLKRLGFEVAGTATHGEAAVAMADRLRPHLVLMDIHLEGATDGITAAQEIQRQNGIPVIYLTAYSDSATLARAKLTGPFGYILKPFDERDLATQIELAIYKHRADRQIREQREWLRVTLTSIGDAVIATDEAGRITFINPVAEALTGWKTAEATGQPGTKVFRIVNEQTGQATEDPLARVLRQGCVVALANHTALVTKDGRIVPIEDSAAPIKDAAGRVIGAVLVFHDVTEKRRANEALRASEEKFRAAFANAAIGFAMKTPEGGYIDANPSYCKLIGYEVAELRTMAFPQVIHPDDFAHYKSLINRMIGGETADFVIESRYKCKDGTLVWVRKSVSLVRDAQGDPQWIIALVEDATERKQAVEALRALNKTLEQQVAERTELAEARAKQMQTLAVELIEAEERERRRVAELLHDDLQQVLAAAKMQLQAVCETLSSEPMLANVGQLLEESIAKSRRLSHDLSPAVLHHSGLVAALQWLARQMGEQFGLQVELETHVQQQFENTPLKVFLFRAVHELLFNIVKHARVKSARVVLSLTEDGLVVEVGDEGRGFNPGNWDFSGSGFGLLSLRERASYIGGGLTVDSAPGRGSRFTLTVPLSLARSEMSQQNAEAAERRPRPPAAGRSTAGKEIRVLFVDDHKVMRQGLIELISGQPGIRVVGEAADGRQALERVRRLRPDVVVMDIAMPRMDGVEATRRIKAEMPDVRVIGLSMLEDEQIVQRMREAGANTFMGKTVSSAELLRAIYGV